MDDLDAQRDAVVSLHQHIRQRVSAGVEADFEQYDERTIVQSIVEASGERLDITALIQKELVGNANVGEMIETIRSQLERQIARRSGHIIAAPLNTELRWYLGPGSK